MDMELLSDNPIDDEKKDLFGFGPFVEILRDAIIDTQSLPFTVGIFGEWGTGKTSLMKLLKRQLESRGYRTIWFKSWKYDTKGDLWTALIRSILIEFSTEIKNKESKEKAEKLIKEVGWFALKAVIPIATSGIIPTNNIEKLKENFTKQSLKEHDFLNKFESEFSKLVRDFTGEKDRLVIFIDDLDRCIPENAITVLESLKLYLDNEHCVFVLGMDRSIIELGIRHRYGADIRLSGREYLEKIVQLPFFLPPIPFVYLKNYLEAQSKAADFTNAIWALLQYGLGGNPRKAKRFVNCFYIAQQALYRPEFLDQFDLRYNANIKMQNSTSPQDQLFYLAKILIIMLSYQDFYDYLLLNPNGWQIYEESLRSEGPTDELSNDQDFWACWQNRRLNSFMEKTTGSEFPPAPSRSVLEYVLNFISLVERPSKLGDLGGEDKVREPSGNEPSYYGESESYYEEPSYYDAKKMKK